MDGESANQFLGQTVVIVADDEFVQVIAEELEDDADVFAEDDKIFDLDYVGLVFFISFFDETEDFDLNKSLFGELGVAFDHLQGYFFMALVIQYLQNIAV